MYLGDVWTTANRTCETLQMIIYNLCSISITVSYRFPLWMRQITKRDFPPLRLVMYSDSLTFLLFCTLGSGWNARQHLRRHREQSGASPNRAQNQRYKLTLLHFTKPVFGISPAWCIVIGRDVSVLC